MLIKLDEENADLDIHASVLCLTDTPDADNPCLCKALIKLGDGVKDLDESGGNFEIRVTVGGQELSPDPLDTIAVDALLRTVVQSAEFLVPANEEVKVYILSPNVADTDVDVTAYLYDLSEVRQTGKILATTGLDSIPVADPTGVADTFPKMLVQLWRRFFKKVTMTATQLKTYKDNGSSIVTTQTVDDDDTTETQGAAS